MINLTTSLKKLVGRMKNNMSAILTTFAGILISAAFIVGVIKSESWWIGLFGLAMGVALLILAFKEHYKEQRKRDSDVENFRMEMRNISSDIHNLVEEIRKDRNERNTKH